MKKNIEKFSVGKKKFFQKIEIDRVGTLERVLDAAKDIPRFPGLYPSKREKKLKAKDPNYRFEGTRYLEMHRLKKKTEQQLKEQMKTKALQKKVSMLVKQPSKESNQVTKSEIDQKINSILSDFLQGETKSKKKIKN